jgi:hypothetical protein
VSQIGAKRLQWPHPARRRRRERRGADSGSGARARSDAPSERTPGGLRAASARRRRRRRTRRVKLDKRGLAALDERGEGLVVKHFHVRRDRADGCEDAEQAQGNEGAHRGWRLA